MVYGTEAVLPIEVGVRSLRKVLESEILEADWLQSRYAYGMKRDLKPCIIFKVTKEGLGKLLTRK